nr:MAG TPA: hypothetical protein [Bacteriophage sp.]
MNDKISIFQIFNETLRTFIRLWDFILPTLSGFRHPLCNLSLITLQRYEKYLKYANYFKIILRKYENKLEFSCISRRFLLLLRMQIIKQ